MVALALPLLPATAADRVPHREAPVEVQLRRAQAYAVRQLARTDERLGAGRFPTVAVGDSPWRTSGTNGWLAGFWPGRLWVAYELTGDRHWARRATTRQAPLAVRAADRSTHDLGFLLQTSFGTGARLTGRTSDRAVLRQAAQSLASRHVPPAKAIRSWNGPVGQATVIVDSLMNLELLFAAADQGGPAAWRELAREHALTVARTHVRPDGSTFHVARFDESTGQLRWRGTVQGLADGSTWARGQSWAVHGFTTAYRETGDPALLEAARRTADFAVVNLPADGVPWWDYDAAGTQRDTTAAAVLASGLLELARLDPDAELRAQWRTEGMRVLRSLARPPYLARGTDAWSVLLRGRHSPTYADAGVTYADFYLLEALQRAQLLPAARPARRVADLRRRSGGGLRADLGAERWVSAVSVRWRDGDQRATRFVVQVAGDDRRWRTVRRGVSSGRLTQFETYDLRDRAVRYVRVLPRQAADGTDGRVQAIRVRR